MTTNAELNSGCVREFRVQSPRNYKDCAKRIAKDLQLWVTANRDQIVSLPPAKVK
jgi:hypothetical protein